MDDDEKEEEKETLNNPLPLFHTVFDFNILKTLAEYTIRVRIASSTLVTSGDIDSRELHNDFLVIDKIREILAGKVFYYVMHPSERDKHLRIAKHINSVLCPRFYSEDMPLLLDQINNSLHPSTLALTILSKYTRKGSRALTQKKRDLMITRLDRLCRDHLLPITKQALFAFQKYRTADLKQLDVEFASLFEC